MSQSTHCDPDALGVTSKLELVSSPYPNLTESERERAMSLMHRDSYYSQIVNTLTTGIFLTGFALQFKTPNFIIGLLVSLPSLAQLLQLPTIGLLKRYGSRQKICAWATMISRLFLIPLLLVPLCKSPQVALILLLVFYGCHNGVGAISLCAWNSLIKDTVPSDRLGLFTSRKLSLNTMMAIVVFLLAGYFIDAWSHEMPNAVSWGYSLLFAVAVLVGLLGVRPLHQLPEPKAPTHAPGTPEASCWSMLKQPLSNQNFRRMLLFMGSWNFSINLAAPFFAVYMLTMLKYPMALVTGITIANQIANLIFVRLWGKLADRFSNKSVLSVAAPLFILCILGWTFIPYTNHVNATIPLALSIQIVLGIATAGVNLATGNIALKLAPEKKPDAYLAVNGMVASVAAGIAPIIGGLFADFFSHQELSFVLQWHNAHNHFTVKTLDFQYWDFFFALAFILGLVSLTLLTRVQEHGEVRKTVIVHHLVHETVRPLKKLMNTKLL